MFSFERKIVNCVFSCNNIIMVAGEKLSGYAVWLWNCCRLQCFLFKNFRNWSWNLGKKGTWVGMNFNKKLRVFGWVGCDSVEKLVKWWRWRGEGGDATIQWDVVLVDDSTQHQTIRPWPHFSPETRGGRRKILLFFSLLVSEKSELGGRFSRLFR